MIPVIVQDSSSNDVLMLAYADPMALRKTRKTGFVHFWSRSRGKLWKKGETSGNVLRVRSLHWDCDRDALLIRAEPAGPACHRGTYSCFAAKPFPAGGILNRLQTLIEGRRRKAPPGSYTAKLLRDPKLRAKKILEEAGEVVLALHSESDKRVAEEAADLLYHLLVGLGGRRVALDRVFEVLEGRWAESVRRKPSSPRRRR